jgi:hypothetical protein
VGTEAGEQRNKGYTHADRRRSSGCLRSTSNSVPLVGGDRKAFRRSAFSVPGARGDVGVLRLRSVVRNSGSFVGQVGVSWRVRSPAKYPLLRKSDTTVLHWQRQKSAHLINSERSSGSTCFLMANSGQSLQERSRSGGLSFSPARFRSKVQSASPACHSRERRFAELLALFANSGTRFAQPPND